MSVKIHMFGFIATYCVRACVRLCEYRRRKGIQLFYPFSWVFILFFCTHFWTSYIFYFYWDRGYHFCSWIVDFEKKKLWCVQYVNKNIDLHFGILPAFKYEILMIVICYSNECDDMKRSNWEKQQIIDMHTHSTHRQREREEER